MPSAAKRLEKERAQAREQKRRKAAASATYIYVGTHHDRELLPCPVCHGSAAGIQMCFRPIGKRTRWEQLDAGVYHLARVPESVRAVLHQEHETRVAETARIVAEARTRLGLEDVPALEEP